MVVVCPMLPFSPPPPPPNEWPNWCLKFIHNQLYEYFSHMRAKWNRSPFHITVARKVQWNTFNHMNWFFKYIKRVINR